MKHIKKVPSKPKVEGSKESSSKSMPKTACVPQLTPL